MVQVTEITQKTQRFEATQRIDVVMQKAPALETLPQNFALAMEEFQKYETWDGRVPFLGNSQEYHMEIPQIATDTTTVRN